MEYAQIRNLLATAAFTPELALFAALPHAKRLAPLIARGLARRRVGVPFTAKTRNTVLRGLYVCAAARRRELWAEWAAFMKVDREDFEDLFGLLDEQAAARITLCLIDTDNSGQVDDLFHLLEDTSLFWAVRHGLWLALARLTAEGRVDRSRTVVMLKAYPEAHLTGGRDYSLSGWIDAVTLLGVEEMMPTVERLWKSDAENWGHFGDADREEYRSQLARALTDTGLSQFDGQMIAPFDHPMDGLARYLWHEHAEGSKWQTKH